MKLMFDNRLNNLNIDNELTDISISEAKAYLDKLDGKNMTLITLGKEDGSILNIGGGNKEKFIITMFKDDVNFTLHNEVVSQTEIELCVGGQYADFPSEIVVSKSLAEIAIDKFWINLESELNFIED